MCSKHGLKHIYHEQHEINLGWRN